MKVFYFKGEMQKTKELQNETSSIQKGTWILVFSVQGTEVTSGYYWAKDTPVSVPCGIWLSVWKYLLYQIEEMLTG